MMINYRLIAQQLSVFAVGLATGWLARSRPLKTEKTQKVDTQSVSTQAQHTAQQSASTQTQAAHVTRVEREFYESGVVRREVSLRIDLGGALTHTSGVVSSSAANVQQSASSTQTEVVTYTQPKWFAGVGYPAELALKQSWDWQQAQIAVGYQVASHFVLLAQTGVRVKNAMVTGLINFNGG